MLMPYFRHVFTFIVQVIAMMMEIRPCRLAQGYAIIWSAVSGEAILRMSPKDVAGSAHQFVRVFPDGGRIVTGVGVSQGKDAVIWNATSGESLLEISSRHMGFEPPVTMLELSPCGEMLVTTSRLLAFMSSNRKPKS